MNEDVLFISQDYLKENSVINDNADFDLIYPTIIMCQDVYLQQAIGTPLYEDLKLAVINYNASPSTTIPTNYSNLITYKIQKMLLWYVQMEALPLLKFRFENKGIMVKSGQDSTPINIPIEDEMSKDERDAFALLTSTFALYDLEELSSVIAGFMKQGLTSNEAIIELRKNKVYQTRFAGNTSRTAAGLNALSEGEYLALEDSYSETLRAYGQQTLLGTDKKTRQARMATIIGSDISAVEFKDRVSTVVTRVENADPLVKSTLRDFYKITDTDLVSYFLNPTENLPKLQEKVTAAEIGSAALAQGGLTTDMTSAESLAKFGVDLATARKGYSTISDVLPTTTKLSQIYKEDNINYNQQVAEEEVFKGLASAQRKRTQLAEKEIASFQGSSGVGAAGLSTTYLRKGSAAGQF